jgi:hypothetical protein
MTQQRKEIKKKEEKIEQDQKIKEPKRKQHGTGVREELTFDNTLLDAIPDATPIIHKNWSEGTSPTAFFLKLNIAKCVWTL